MSNWPVPSFNVSVLKASVIDGALTTPPLIAPPLLSLSVLLSGSAPPGLEASPFSTREGNSTPASPGIGGKSPVQA